MSMLQIGQPTVLQKALMVYDYSKVGDFCINWLESLSPS